MKLLAHTGTGRHDRCLPGAEVMSQQNSGTITLTSELYEADSYYYALGLSFDEGNAVPTLPDADRADITVSGRSSRYRWA
ncbi:MAG: hypothetical protein MZV63_48235 [Marinilabiliales bacterium]|nr:hypothetical protein [Marinilabiliales bacterium]